MAPDRAAYSPSLLTAAADAGMFVFGIVMALLGAVLPLISARIHFDLAQAGNLFLVMNCAMLAAMLTLGVLMDAIGQKPILVAGAVAVTGALAIFIRAGTYAGVLIAAAILGAGGGALNGATNTLVSDLHSDPRRKASALNMLGVFFGFGALLLPFTIGALLGALGLETILWGAAGLSAVLAAAFLAPRFPPPKQTARAPMAEAFRLVRHPLVLLIALLLFFESGNEFIFGGYISTYLIRENGATVVSASYVLAAYWAAMMMMRIAASRLLFRITGATLVRISALSTAAAVAFLVVASHSLPVAALAVVLIGIGCASIYPTTLGEAGSRFANYSGTVFGIIFALAMVGGMTMPWAVGQIAASAGLRWAFTLAPLNAIAIFFLQIRIMRIK